jgi:hypothetical protein
MMHISRLGRLLEDVYMRKRIDSSLGYLTPVEFEMQWNQQLAQATEAATLVAPAGAEVID